MAKHAKKSGHLQLVDLPKTTTVEIPLPLLGAFAHIENSFFDLCIDAGRQVLDAMLEQDREALCGSRWKRDPDRSAGRTGTTQSEVTLGGRRIPISPPSGSEQGGSGDGAAELRLRGESGSARSSRSKRRGLRHLDPQVRPEPRSVAREDVEERSTSKSSVSRRYVAMTTKQMTKWLTTPLGDRHFPIVMIDGINLGDHMVLIALGIDFEGKKQVLGLREGNTENSRVAKALLRDLVDRGLDPERARLFVIDGAKALTSAIREGVRFTRCDPSLSDPQGAKCSGAPPGSAAGEREVGAEGGVGPGRRQGGETQARASGLLPRSRPSRGGSVGARGSR